MSTPTESRQLRAHKLVDFAPQLGAFTHHIVFGASCDGAVCVVAAKDEDQPEEWRIVEWRDGVFQRCDLKRSESIDFVQAIGDGFVLVTKRCEWHESGPDQNALFFDWCGDVSRRLTLGAGVSQLRATPDESLWIAYSHHAYVAERYAWGHAYHIVEKVGFGGVRIAKDGEVDPFFGYPCEDELEVSDLEIINVPCSGECWFMPDLGMPIQRLTPERTRSWEWGNASIRALAATPSRVLLLLEDVDDHIAEVLRLGHGDDVQLEAHAHIVDPSGESLDRCAAQGVGQRLYFQRGTEIYALDEW